MGKGEWGWGLCGLRWKKGGANVRTGEGRGLESQKGGGRGGWREGRQRGKFMRMGSYEIDSE